MRIAVRAHPGASHERVRWEGDVLHVWVTARAVEGAANRALIEALARALGVHRSAVTLVSGERARDKVVEVAGSPSPLAGEVGRPRPGGGLRRGSNR